MDKHLQTVSFFQASFTSWGAGLWSSCPAVRFPYPPPNPPSLLVSWSLAGAKLGHLHLLPEPEPGDPASVPLMGGFSSVSGAQGHWSRFRASLWLIHFVDVYFITSICSMLRCCLRTWASRNGFYLRLLKATSPADGLLLWLQRNICCRLINSFLLCFTVLKQKIIAFSHFKSKLYL